MEKLKFLYTDRYGGGDGRAISRHVTRVYEDENGIEYHLDRDMSMIPPCFEALGPIPIGFKGITPLIKINGERYFGDGISWPKAIKIFMEAVDKIRAKNLLHHDKLLELKARLVINQVNHREFVLNGMRYYCGWSSKKIPDSGDGNTPYKVEGWLTYKITRERG
jgi:hypothetical protein